MKQHLLGTGITMNSSLIRKFFSFFSSADGKGTTGCLFSLALIAAVSLAGIRVVPVYYAVKSFETDMQTEVSRAGAHFYGDEVILNNLVELAKRNELRIEREQIKLERLAGQVFVKIHYTTSVDFIVFERDLSFDMKASSFIGRL
jgi:hypothetical protein